MQAPHPPQKKKQPKKTKFGKKNFKKIGQPMDRGGGQSGKFLQPVK
jgi:hypothetical protein